MGRVKWYRVDAHEQVSVLLTASSLDSASAVPALTDTIAALRSKSFIISHAEEGVSEVKENACRLLLERRLETKMHSKKVDSILSRINVVRPEARDGKARSAHIPESVLRRRRDAAAAAAAASSSMDEDVDKRGDEDEKSFAPGAASRGTGARHVGIKGRTGGKAVSGKLSGGRKTQKQIMWENGGPGVYAQKMYEHWQLKRKEWQTDIVRVFVSFRWSVAVQPVVLVRSFLLMTLP